MKMVPVALLLSPPTFSVEELASELLPTDTALVLASVPPMLRCELPLLTASSSRRTPLLASPAAIATVAPS